MPMTKPMAAVIQMEAGGEAANREAFLDDDARAQKTDAGHAALRHARGIDAVGLQRDVRQQAPLIVGEQHQLSRRAAYEGVRAKTRGAAMIGAFEADDAARE